MSRVLYGPDDCTNCFKPAPEIGGCGPVCEERVKCCEVVPCKTRLRDAVRMKPREIEREFYLHEFGCKGEMIPPTVTRIGMKLRRRASCCEVACMAPFRATLDGAVVFRWPDDFLAAEPGQYEGDLYINDCEVGSVLLIKPDRKVTVEYGEPVECDFGCADGDCAEPCGGCNQPSCRNCSPCGDYAEVDGDPDTVETVNCEECETC